MGDDFHAKIFLTWSSNRMTFSGATTFTVNNLPVKLHVYHLYAEPLLHIFAILQPFRLDSSRSLFLFVDLTRFYSEFILDQIPLHL